MGMVRGVQLVLRLARRGLLYVGLPCSSYVFMSSSKHGRSEQRPEGNDFLPFVANANCLCARAMLLACLAIARQAFWCLEQPSTSKVVFDPYLNMVLNLNDPTLNIMHQHTLWPGTYTSLDMEFKPNPGKKS